MSGTKVGSSHDRVKLERLFTFILDLKYKFQVMDI